jgi:hypothetical protein
LEIEKFTTKSTLTDYPWFKNKKRHKLSNFSL